MLNFHKWFKKASLVAIWLPAQVFFASELFSQEDMPASNLLPEAPGSSTSESEFAPQVSIPITIDLKERCALQGNRVNFDALAICRGANSICDELMGVDLGPGPKPGSTRVITQEQIRKVLTQEFPQVIFNLQGPQRISISGDFQEITQEMLQSYLFDALSASIEANKNIRVDHVQVHIPRPIKVPPGDLKIRFPLVEGDHSDRLDWITANVVGSHSFEVVYTVGDDAKAQSVRFPAQITMSMNLPTARSELMRGSIIEHADLEYVWTGLTQQTTGAIGEILALVGMKVVQPLRTGHAILKRHIAAQTLIKRGDIVSVVLKNGEMEVHSRGKALSSGVKGQSIPIVYPATKKQIQGRVIESGRVEVMM